jgi:hypothetical protein
MNKTLFLLGCIFYLFPIHAMHLSSQEEQALYALQKEKAIPLFSINEKNKTGLQEETLEIALPQDTFSLIVGKHILNVRTADPTEEPVLFNPEALAIIITYAIGINNQEGNTLVKKWSEWSPKVPHAFLYELETLLEKNYPQFEEKEISKLSLGVYIPKIDTSLIDRYVAIIKAILDQKATTDGKTSLTDKEKTFISTLARSLTKGRIIRNGSPHSKWISHSKKVIIQTLYVYEEGKRILDELSLNNPILTQEIEAFTDTTFAA